MPTKIICASLNFQRLDETALKELSGAHLSDDKDTINKFKKLLGFPIEQIAIIEKCNAVMVVIFYCGDLADDSLRNRILDTWDKLSKGEISTSLKHIKFFENENAVKYLGECAVGLHSVTIGDSQVLSQISDAFKNAIDFQQNSPSLQILNSWIKNVVEEVRLRTNIFDGNTSLERIASEVIENKIKIDKDVSIIGLGKSGKLVLKILADELNYKTKITNRTKETTIREAGNREVVSVDFDDYAVLANSSCIIFALTSNNETKEYANNLSNHVKKNKEKPELIVDLCSPSIIKKADWVGVPVITIEDLSKEAEKNMGKRMTAVNKARDIVSKQYVKFAESLKKETSKIFIDKHIMETNHKLDQKKIELYKIRNFVYKKIREILDRKDFVEINTPYIVGVSTDPAKVDKGSTIDVIWQGEGNAFLRQSNQLYKQMVVASGLPKIYEIGPFWRAETYQSYRHLQESIGLDIEMQKPKNLEELYRLAYSVILDVKNHVWRECGIHNNDFVLPDFGDLPIINYDEAIKILNLKGHHINLGEDLGMVGEAKLGQIIKREKGSDAFVVKNYPDTVKKFYTKKIEGGNTETFDIIISGWELVSGAIRETNRSIIEKSMRLSGINTLDYSFYLSIVDGSVPHGGFCLGIDRLVAKILDFEVVSDAVVFPRTFKTLIP